MGKCVSCGGLLQPVRKYDFKSDAFRKVYSDRYVYSCVECGLSQTDVSKIDESALSGYYRAEYRAIARIGVGDPGHRWYRARATALAKRQLAELDTTSHDTTTPASEQPTLEAMGSVPMQDPIATPALPEAPASANCYVNLAGHNVQITLRDSNEEQLLSRMEKLRTRFPAEEPGATTPPEGWCHKHNVQMKLNHGKRGTWWSHKLPNGPWCNKR